MWRLKQLFKNKSCKTNTIFVGYFEAKVLFICKSDNSLLKQSFVDSCCKFLKVWSKIANILFSGQKVFYACKKKIRNSNSRLGEKKTFSMRMTCTVRWETTPFTWGLFFMQKNGLRFFFYGQKVWGEKFIRRISSTL